MRSPAVVALLAVLIVSVAPTTAAAQNQWVPPQPPCDVNAGSFFRLNSAVVDLKKAVEQPTLREHLLAQALDVLTRTIRDDHQDKNPAAWYYLGRYFVERTDAAGADTAFTRAVALAPKCDKDVAGYRAQLYGGLLADGQRTWQESKIDSSLRLLRLATRLVPDNPRAYFIIGAVFTANDQADSASAYLSKGVAAAGADTAYAAAKKDALGTVARGALRHAQADPAAQQWTRTRYSRDSLARVLANDSSVLARMQGSAASRRARGARLSPADQRAFATDSTARAQTVERDIAARTDLAGRVARDSAAVAAAFGPAVAAYQQYITSFPTDADAVVTLAALYSQSARPGEAARVFDEFFGHSAGVDAEVLFDLGQRLVGGGMVATGIKAYALGLQKNPWSRNALYEVGTAYLGLKDTSNAVAAVQKLVAVDPLNRASLRLAAGVWDLRGRRDSAQKYAVRADSTLPVDITVGSFVPDNAGYVLTAVATNLRQATAQPFRLTFEFLDARGEVQGTQTADIPAIAPGGNNQFQVHVNGKGLTGWRYRPS